MSFCCDRRRELEEGYDYRIVALAQTTRPMWIVECTSSKAPARSAPWESIGMAITHCPWCGVRLQADHVVTLRHLSGEHERVLDESPS